MSRGGAHETSLFRFHIKNRRFDEFTLRVLESVLASKDVKSFMEVRSNLKEFMRSEFPLVVPELAKKTVDQKLLVLDFFVRAFALAGDDESCLALRYEALALRGFESRSYLSIQVSYSEWLSFAEHSLEKGFNSIARTACENALSCLQMNNIASEAYSFENDRITKEIKRLEVLAVASAAPCSVQAQAMNYLKRRTMERSIQLPSIANETTRVASTSFMNGIKKRNVQNLHQSIGLSHRHNNCDCN